MADPAQPASPQAIRRGRKLDQVLEGARTVFMAHGFEGAGVDEIARTAGVSKATLYAYFPDKRLLFLEVVRHECLRQADAALAEIDPTAPPETVLRRGARRIVEFYTSEFGRGVERLRAAESERFPELGRQFYAAGPEMARARIGEYLAAACDRGELSIADIPLAADQFVKLCEADLHDRVSCGLQTRFSEAEIARVIDGAVALFLARYGPT
jgi:AcrR family transcriptional regulator